MTKWESDFIATHRVARLATVSDTGQPYVVPIVYAFDGDRFYTPIDAKPKRVGVYQLQRVRNIQANSKVALIIDDYSEDWQRLAWVQVKGEAKIITTGQSHTTGIELLHRKYSQYELMPLTNRPIIIITPKYITGWRAAQ